MTSYERASQPRVAVILLNWNGWRDTLQCLDSLAKLSYRQFDIVICDNGSTDESLTRLTQWFEASGWPYNIVDRNELNATDRGEGRATIIKNGYNAGFAGGNNVAIRYALESRQLYKYVWVLNNDTVVDVSSLDELVQTLENDADACAAQSLLLKRDDPQLIDSAGMRLLWRGGAKDILAWQSASKLFRAIGGTKRVEIFGCCAASALYRADALNAVGLFDESFFAMSEDVDLACRLKSRGYKALLAVQSAVLHKGGISRNRKKGGSLLFLSHRNKLRVVARWWPRWVATPVVVLGFFRAFGVMLRSPDVPLRAWTELGRCLLAEIRVGATEPTRRALLQSGSASFLSVQGGLDG